MSDARFVSAKANVSEANVNRARASGRSQNEARTRQAIRGIKDMFRKDGLR
jgi:hypothetical protein